MCVGLLCIFLMNVAAHGEVSVKVFLRDSNEVLQPVDVNSALLYTDYGQIMEGTQLAILVDSNTVELNKYMGLYIEDDYRNYGLLSARGPEMDFFDSIFDAAGKSTSAWISPVAGYWPEEDKEMTGFDLMTGFAEVSIGDWFIFDYDTLAIGDCSVTLYCYEYPNPNAFLIQELRFSHVATRDFNADGRVNFVDFSILAKYWGNDCSDPKSCEGVNLEEYGLIDINDLTLFADFWLEKSN